MRLAIVTSYLAERRELEPGPLDAEWLEELLDRGNRLALFVDQASAGSERLRSAGQRVSVSLRRSTLDNEGRWTSPDRLQARVLAKAHEAEPFEAILYSADMGSDLSWYEPSLRGVPRGAVLGGSPLSDLRRVFEVPELFAERARQLWALSGLWTSADFLVSDVPLRALGLGEDVRLPPLRRSGPPRTAASPGECSARWVAVVATQQGPAALSGLMAALVAAVPPRPDVTYFLLLPSAAIGALPYDDLMALDATGALRRRSVVVHPGPDGVAAELLAETDLVVVASRAELTIPAVAEAAARVGVLLLDETRHDEAGDFVPSFDASPPPATRSTSRIRALTAGEAALAPAIEGGSAQEWTLVHADGHARELHHFLELGIRAGVDVVVWGQPHPNAGEPQVELISPHAVAVCPEMWPLVHRLFSSGHTLWDTVLWLLDTRWIDRHRILVLPGQPDGSFLATCGSPIVTRAWSPRQGILPAPRFTSGPAPPPVVLPPAQVWKVVKPQRTDLDSVDAWARQHRWLDRARLAMPWRFGILDRAMRGRW